ncbi:MAG: hypothetical protein OJJ21_16625, partial [Ferrovibrio sp.]|uniref:hypothetical protein n=1 Tax=Ferrovibrio sp. TaxID=1917215 RepID=UPI00263365AE
MPVNEIATGILIKFLGSIAGAILALLRFPPRTRSEAARRISSSIIVGVISASVVVYKIGLEN